MELLHVTQCPNCFSNTEHGLAPWHFICRKCGLEMSTLRSVVDSTPQTDRVDENARETGLKDIRQHNFAKIAQIVKHNLDGANPRLLDVGCAHGWFLDEMKKVGFDARGIEPSASIAKTAKERGLEVVVGLFPRDLSSKDLFDAISFNDVFEHIPDAVRILESVHSHLNDNGLLVLSIPSSKGFFYRLSVILYRLGLRKPFERMWQKDFPSPHLYYFNSGALKSMTSSRGFVSIYEGTLPSIRINGLWARLNLDESSNFIFNAIAYAAIVILYPALFFARADIDLLVFEKINSAS